MPSSTTTLDRFLDYLEDRLPALPAASLRVQRRIGERMLATTRGMCSELRGSAEAVADRSKEAADNVADELETETRQVAETVSTEVDDVRQRGRRVVAEARDQAVEALDAVETVADPDRTPTGETYENLTKGQLYERAAERDIAGRSKMSKSELIDALVAAD